MKKLLIAIVLLTGLSFGACDLLDDVDTGLSEAEIVEGLKTALTVGTDTSATTLNSTDGYYKDEIVKILLPPEGQVMYEYVDALESYLGSDYIENTVLRINRAAEDAASEAKPIFANAITDMTINDGMNILQGKSPDGAKADFDSTAATAYLRVKTYDQLVGAYAPKIDHSLDQAIVGNVSANDAWNECTYYYNTYVTLFNNEDPIDVSLGEYATGKALDGLFFKIGEEEKEIRKDPYKWALDILNKVFGFVYEEQNTSE
jgi:hypothetical protein